MKKLLLLLSVFALVAGLSQCKKPKLPVINPGETQHVVLNASWDNGGSKLEPDGTLFKWTIGDKLYVDKVGGTSIGTLICKDPENGTFEGYIGKVEGKITFTFRGANYKENFMEQTGALNDAVLLKSQELAYSTDGNYGTVSMKMPHAVLLLDLSKLGTAEGTQVTIKADGDPVASVSNVNKESKNVYVAFPVEKSKDAKIYEFVSSVGSARCKGWELEENTFYTLKNGEGAAIVVEPTLLPGKFSVSAVDYVQFSRGNLQATYNGSGYTFAFAPNQYDYVGGRNGDGVGSITGNNTIDAQTVGAVVDLFGWSTSNTNYGIHTAGEGTGATVYGGEFKDWGTAIDGTGNWCTLSGTTSGEWVYLLEKRTVNGGSGEGYTYTNKASGIVLQGNTYYGLFIYPDDYDKPLIGTAGAPSTWEDINASGIVFLPAAGYRYASRVESFPGIRGSYWASTECGNDKAYDFYYISGIVYDNLPAHERCYGFSVRLVQRFPKPEIEPTFVDLGLPSHTLWADVNVGATAKTGAGSVGKFYAWGETESKSSFTLDNYKFTSSFNRYNSTDGLTELQLADDVAAMKVSGSHIPTRAQYEELINSTYTTCTWTDDYNSTGVPGLVITSKSNSNSIFLPAAGLQDGASPSLVGTHGCYWSSSLNSTPKEGPETSFPACAIDLDFDQNTSPFVYKDYDDSRRSIGQAIRSVKQKPVPAGFVDLGLSVYWASENIPGYYQFGATSQATGNGWNTTPYYQSGAGEDESWVFLKYNTVGETLKAVDDAAAVAGKGRIPSIAEWDELRTKCDWTWNGSGFTVTSKINGNSISLPANGNNGEYVGLRGNYWANEVGDNNYDAHHLYFDSSGAGAVSSKFNPRKEAFGIRSVHD